MRRGFLAALFFWLTPLLAVAAGGLGLPRTPAILAAAGFAALIAARCAPVLQRRLGDARLTTAASIVLAVATVVAIVRIAAFSVFIADVNRIAYSVEPHDDFRRTHSCLSAYAESARFLHEGGHNIYERSLYRPGNVARELGPLKVDPFHYPPPFLLLPQAIRAIAPDFWDVRRIWFAMQALVLSGAIVGLAGWIGGHRGGMALLGGVLLLAFPHPVAAMQQGNFQITAVCLAAIAFAMLLAGRQRIGGTVLAYAALAKIFPGILVVPLVTGRYWRQVAWIAGAAVVLLALTVAVQGTQPIRDFVSTALPEISSGAAFPQTELPQHSRVNWSAYGQTVRLRHLGATFLTQPAGLMASQVYGVAVVALAAWVGWKRRLGFGTEADRLAVVQIALALISLASFRSPFVGAIYGIIATLWLMGLCAAGATSLARQVAWLLATCGLAWVVWILPSPAHQAPAAWVWLSGLLVLGCMGVNVWAVATALPGRDAIDAPVSARVGLSHGLP